MSTRRSQRGALPELIYLKTLLTPNVCDDNIKVKAVLSDKSIRSYSVFVGRPNRSKQERRGDYL